MVPVSYIFQEPASENHDKIASYIPLEWKNGKLEKVLLTSMDVTQEKKAEIESRQALKEAYRSAENENRAKTEFLSNMSHDIRTPKIGRAHV